MLLTKLFFEPLDREDAKVNLASWFSPRDGGFWKKTPRWLQLWIFVQMFAPLRMPVVSNMEYPYTNEGYRFSWTMMLHSKSSYIEPGMHLFSVYPLCQSDPYPNPRAFQDPTVGPNEFDFVNLIGIRGYTALNLFPRQLPRFASYVRASIASSGACPASKVAVTVSMFASVDDGPYVRLVDPSKNIAFAHDMKMRRGMLASWMDAATDSAPPGFDHLLRNFRAEAMVRQYAETTGDDDDDWHYLVDRSPCLAFDPVRFYSVAVTIRAIKTPKPIRIKRCDDVREASCHLLEMREGDVFRAKGISRMVYVGIVEGDGEEDRRRYGSVRCAHPDQQEDVVIAFRRRRSVTERFQFPEEEKRDRRASLLQIDSEATDKRLERAQRRRRRERTTGRSSVSSVTGGDTFDESDMTRERKEL